jgi:hypothetical protein
MPEAAMYKNNSSVFGQYHVGLAGQLFIVQPVTSTIGMQKFSHQHFGFGIGAADAAHVITTGFGTVHICHEVNFGTINLPLNF